LFPEELEITMMNRCAVVCLGVALVLGGFAGAEEGAGNLLLNPSFEFHAFANHRLGERENFKSHNTAFWNTDGWGDIEVVREAHVDAAIRPAFSTSNLVAIAPGKTVWQFIPLSEAGLAHGDHVSLHVFGHQPAANALVARVVLMKLDSEDGTWKPSDLGMSDSRTFPRHSRGELVAAKRYEASSETPGAIELRVANAEILGRFHRDNKSYSDDINTIALQVEFENTATEGAAWVYAPSLCAGATPATRLRAEREPYPYYRHIPRTMQKLWKGEALHVILMGSSIDRGSANPPMYCYDENPDSPTFKQPLSNRIFEPEVAGRPDLDGYVGEWRHYWSYTGRLRLELMRKFNLPVSKICMNYMACDGSSVGEAHSGLKDYCALTIPPSEEMNGHKKGTTWQGLYPDLFARPEGPRPDLVIFGSGANEKTDTPNEMAVFEGTIRWMRRHYPNTEFLFCLFQNRGGYSANAGDLQALALRYQIPYLDYGRVGDDAIRWCNPYALVPSDGHPQAASHYLWFKALERAFECWDPVVPGQAQLQLPERMHPNTYGWEGDMRTYAKESPRIAGNKFIFDDTAINCWGSAKEGKPTIFVDGESRGEQRPSAGRNVRNSLYRCGDLRLGDRHILEVTGTEAVLTYVDAKVCPNRRFIGVDSPRWALGEARVTDFTSTWGAPYGAKQVVLNAGQSIQIDTVCTDVSVAYDDSATSGSLRVTVDGTEKLIQPANIPFVDAGGAEHYLENRKGILGLPYGLHSIEVEAGEGPVAVLGLFTYDSRSNQAAERRATGLAHAGETVEFSVPFKARPVVLCTGDLTAKTEDITPTSVTFSGKGSGAYEIIGE
jgi:hypothetical protein